MFISGDITNLNMHTVSARKCNRNYDKCTNVLCDFSKYIKSDLSNNNHNRNQVYHTKYT